MAAGHGGQVLLSETTARLLDSAPELRDLGEHRLKDLTAPQHLYQLGDEDFPPPRTLYRTNLPIQPTPLVGRERELEEAGALLRSHRLLTLTGPGEAARRGSRFSSRPRRSSSSPMVSSGFRSRRCATPPSSSARSAASVGADDGADRTHREQALLVLLDNFEQVIEAAPTVSALLAATPNAKVLVTSREPLHLESEQRYPVEPLPDDDAEVLFIERARAVAPGFRPTAPSARSADASTGCRSRSSWRPPASRCSTPTSSSRGWSSGCPS